MTLRDWILGERSEREKWAAKLAAVRPAAHVGLGALDARSAALYGQALPRGCAWRAQRPTGRP